jgi:hypothetical protein
MPSDSDVLEAIQLARRTKQFFRTNGIDSLEVFPEFLGCGWLSSCAGDVYAQGTLYEIKAGDRAFRSIDLRQLLTYCALNFAAKKYDIADVCLLNPREGTFAQFDLNALCGALAGRSAVEVLGDIVEYVSDADENSRAG